MIKKYSETLKDFILGYYNSPIDEIDMDIYIDKKGKLIGTQVHVVTEDADDEGIMRLSEALQKIHHPILINFSNYLVPLSTKEHLDYHKILGVLRHDIYLRVSVDFTGYEMRVTIYTNVRDDDELVTPEILEALDSIEESFGI